MATKAYYVCLALLLVVGIQLNTCECKSVGDKFKDDHYKTREQSLSKANINEQNNEEEATTLPSDENPEIDNDEETTPVMVITTPKPLKRRIPSRKRTTTTTTTTTTTESNDDESVTASPEESEEVKEDEKEEEPEEEQEELEKEQEEQEAPTVKPIMPLRSKPKNQKKVKPATAAPSISDRINAEEEETPSTSEPYFPKQPATNLLPPLPDSYFPQNFVDFMIPTQSIAPWGFNPMYASFPTAYDYPRPSGPAFSDSKVGKGSGNVAVGNGFASASASASASGSGSGGTVSTSTSPGNGYAPNSFSMHRGSIPTGGNHPNSGSFVSIRGSFPSSDEDSVAIEVNGPVSTGDSSYEPTYDGSGPNYAATGSYAPNSYSNNAPNYGNYANPGDLQSFFQQYFAALQAQQQAFQQQLQAQIDAQRQANGAFASSSAFITNDQGMVDPKSRVYANTNTSPNYVSSSSSINSHSGFQNSRNSDSVFSSTNNKNFNRMWEQSNQVDSNFGAYGSPHSTGPQSAYAGASLGPNGGFQAAHISPAAPGIFSRFAEDVPAPSGGHVGIFTSSSSSSSTGPDGKPISHKSATIGINDNGKVSYKTVHDP